LGNGKSFVMIVMRTVYPVLVKTQAIVIAGRMSSGRKIQFLIQNLICVGPFLSVQEIAKFVILRHVRNAMEITSMMRVQTNAN
jgi:hypothetical protein